MQNIEIKPFWIRRDGIIEISKAIHPNLLSKAYVIRGKKVEEEAVINIWKKVTAKFI